MRPKFLLRLTILVFVMLSAAFIILSIESDNRTCDQLDGIRQAQQNFSAICAAIELVILAFIWRKLFRQPRDTQGIKLELGAGN